RLSEIDGILPYYKELPEFRCQQYETYRFQPGFFGISGQAGPTIPDALRSKELIQQLEKNAPGAKERLLSWLKKEVVADLYAFGNHPELRLYTAIALWFRLQESGFLDDGVEKSYQGRVFELTFGEAALTG